uniref:ABC transmembrane type-1 domain-containing protein n=1 Tax=Chromera velia CCMP2878 TaxID=1169474 RepID=A0A0G4GLC0_9ALVE|eukprot:Cvel_4859.t1-p1 / transcript=Cvel_4859.t1 / gene=Cvel_4859 / organism=Chromera_velia_CCMP2878 / gene_product=hypothetical protein / transcript_product=hypothetical protein / location=Cvel_scaffold219:46902-53690(+) / protein_length=1329 / sequence_SO=supercontig / SO=protein_coding / is_pseudo=false
MAVAFFGESLSLLFLVLCPLATDSFLRQSSPYILLSSSGRHRRRFRAVTLTGSRRSSRPPRWNESLARRRAYSVLHTLSALFSTSPQQQETPPTDGIPFGSSAPSALGEQDQGQPGFVGHGGGDGSQPAERVESISSVPNATESRAMLRQLQAIGPLPTSPVLPPSTVLPAQSLYPYEFMGDESLFSIVKDPGRKGYYQTDTSKRKATQLQKDAIRDGIEEDYVRQGRQGPWGEAFRSSQQWLQRGLRRLGLIVDPSPPMDLLEGGEKKETETEKEQKKERRAATRQRQQRLSSRARSRKRKSGDEDEDLPPHHVETVSDILFRFIQSPSSFFLRQGAMEIDDKDEEEEEDEEDTDEEEEEEGEGVDREPREKSVSKLPDMQKQQSGPPQGSRVEQAAPVSGGGVGPGAVVPGSGGKGKGKGAPSKKTLIQQAGTLARFAASLPWLGTILCVLTYTVYPWLARRGYWWMRGMLKRGIVLPDSVTGMLLSVVAFLYSTFTNTALNYLMVRQKDIRIDIAKEITLVEELAWYTLQNRVSTYRTMQEVLDSITILRTLELYVRMLSRECGFNPKSQVRKLPRSEVEDKVRERWSAPSSPAAAGGGKAGPGAGVGAGGKAVGAAADVQQEEMRPSQEQYFLHQITEICAGDQTVLQFVRDLRSLRASRTAVERTSVSSIHYNLFTAVLAMGLCIVWLSAMLAGPSGEMLFRFAFAIVLGVFMWVYELMAGLNDPYSGLYTRNLNFNKPLKDLRNMIAQLVDTPPVRSPTYTTSPISPSAYSASRVAQIPPLVSERDGSVYTNAEKRAAGSVQTGGTEGVPGYSQMLSSVQQQPSEPLLNLGQIDDQIYLHRRSELDNWYIRRQQEKRLYESWSLHRRQQQEEILRRQQEELEAAQRELRQQQKKQIKSEEKIKSGAIVSLGVSQSQQQQQQQHRQQEGSTEKTASGSNAPAGVSPVPGPIGLKAPGIMDGIPAGSHQLQVPGPSQSVSVSVGGDEEDDRKKGGNKETEEAQALAVVTGGGKGGGEQQDKQGDVQTRPTGKDREEAQEREILKEKEKKKGGGKGGGGILKNIGKLLRNGKQKEKERGEKDEGESYSKGEQMERGKEQGSTRPQGNEAEKTGEENEEDIQSLLPSLLQEKDKAGTGKVQTGGTTTGVPPSLSSSSVSPAPSVGQGLSPPAVRDGVTLPVPSEDPSLFFQDVKEIGETLFEGELEGRGGGSQGPFPVVGGEATWGIVTAVEDSADLHTLGEGDRRDSVNGSPRAHTSPIPASNRTQPPFLPDPSGMWESQAASLLSSSVPSPLPTSVGQLTSDEMQHSASRNQTVPVNSVPPNKPR